MESNSALRNRPTAHLARIPLLIAALLLSLSLAGCGEKAPATEQVSFSIDASAAVEAGWTGQADLFQGDLLVPADATVLDALDASKANYTESGGYIRSIQGLAERQYGSTSGWTYQVNGKYPMTTAGKYKIQAGDVIAFVYTTQWTDM